MNTQNKKTPDIKEFVGFDPSLSDFNEDDTPYYVAVDDAFTLHGPEYAQAVMDFFKEAGVDIDHKRAD